jgi:hypothetical protein
MRERRSFLSTPSISWRARVPLCVRVTRRSAGARSFRAAVAKPEARAVGHASLSTGAGGWPDARLSRPRHTRARRGRGPRHRRRRWLARNRVNYARRAQGSRRNGFHFLARAKAPNDGATAVRLDARFVDTVQFWLVVPAQDFVRTAFAHVLHVREAYPELFVTLEREAAVRKALPLNRLARAPERAGGDEDGQGRYSKLRNHVRFRGVAYLLPERHRRW